MTDALLGARAKLDRGREHLQTFKASVDWTFQNLTSPMITRFGQFDSSDQTWVETIDAVAELPAAWGLIAGDAVHNFHAALDYLVWELAFIDNGGLEPQHPQRLQFPLISRQSRSWRECSQDFDDKKSTHLRGVTQRHVAMIKRRQPYHRWKDNRPHPLGTLLDLDNDGKHRLLQPAFFAAAETRLVVPSHGQNCRVDSGRWRGQSVAGRPLEVGTELVRLPVCVSGPDPRMDVECELAAFVAFRNGLPIEETLEEMAAYVEEILDDFSPVFETAKALRVWRPREGRIQRPPPRKGARIQISQLAPTHEAPPSQYCAQDIGGWQVWFSHGVEPGSTAPPWLKPSPHWYVRSPIGYIWDFDAANLTSDQFRALLARLMGGGPDIDAVLESFQPESRNGTLVPAGSGGSDAPC